MKADPRVLDMLLAEARRSVAFHIEHVELHYSHAERTRRVQPLYKLLKDIDAQLRGEEDDDDIYG